jgi:hypothetical protein
VCHYRIIEINNLEPLKIGAIGTQSTYTEPTAEYIPGSTIRGALIGQLIRLQLFNDSTKSDILLGMECYNAYPYFENTFYLPKPFHLRIDKHEWRKAKVNNEEKLKLFDLLEEKENKEIGKNQLEYSFITVENDCLRGRKVAKEYRLHHSTGNNQKPKQTHTSNQPDSESKERENLFRYQAISTGQSFRAILKYKAELEQQMNALLKENRILYFGGSKGSGYGKSQMRTVTKPLQDYREIKEALGIKSFPKNNRDEIIITCLSDCLFRNDFGQPINHLSEKYLYDLTGKEAKLERQFIRTGQTEGYNTTWKARYPKETTVKAGSILKYSFPEGLTSDEIHSLIDFLEEQPAGGRTQDGYGWLGVNIAYPEKLLIDEKKSAADEDVHIDLDELLKKERIKNTFEILKTGMQEAKERWLMMLFTQLFRPAGEGRQREFFISDGLNKHQMKNMEDLIDDWIKSKGGKNSNKAEGKVKTILERYYANDNQLFFLKGSNLTEVFNYLDGSPNETLREFANMKLNTQRGSLFYFNEEKAEEQFIADLLKTGLYIERMRRDKDE